MPLFTNGLQLQKMRHLAVPKVVALCGPGKAGSYGLASLRHLASQGVRTCAYLPTFPMYPAMVDAELNLYKLCLKKQEHVLVHDAAKDLPVSLTPAKPEPFYLPLNLSSHPKFATKITAV